MSNDIKINSPVNATATLLFRFLKLILIINIIIGVIFYYLWDFEDLLETEIVILIIGLIVYLPAREAESVIFEQDKLVVIARTFFFFRVRQSSDYKKIQYKFLKPPDKRSGPSWFPGKGTKLILFRNRRKWVKFSVSSGSWTKSKIVDLVRELLAKGCYNYFEFDKKR
jgi:hypothetical protein